MNVRARIDTAPPPAELYRSWQRLKAERPGLRNRDAAHLLGVSEAQLLACDPTTRRLDGDWGRLLELLPTLGPVMALSRNEQVVIEKTGPVERVDIYRDHGMGAVVGQQIDLRLFLSHWRYGFAVTQPTRDLKRYSLQFFDDAGTAIHKVFLTAGSDQGAYRWLVDSFAATAATPPLTIRPAPAPEPATPDEQVDVAGLRRAWQAMSDTHQFYGLLSHFGVSRLQALGLAGPELARPVARLAHRRVLEGARELGLPIMIFVGNRGILQIHTGPVERLGPVGPWYNVLDPDFNLHLREDGVSEAWVVRKPTLDGEVTSLELFDRQGELLLQCYGRRKGGQLERAHWRQLLDGLSGREGT